MQGAGQSTLNLRIPSWTNNAKASINTQSLTVPAPGVDLLSLSLSLSLRICYRIFQRMNRSKSKKKSWHVSAVALFLVQNFNYFNNLIIPNSISKTCFTNQKLTIFLVISFMMQVITYR